MLITENAVIPSPDQWFAVIRGMRNPLESWAKSDSTVICKNLVNEEVCPGVEALVSKPCVPYFSLGKNDRELMLRLSKAGPDHAKFRRMIPVLVDIKAPLYFWKEFDTYRTGVAPNPTDIEINSCSTMHKIHSRDLDLSDFSWEHLDPQDLGVLEGTINVMNYHRKRYLELKSTDPVAAKQEWYKMIQLLPTSYEQTRTMFCNYEALSHMYHSRKAHKLMEWRTLCSWIKSLPYSEIITGEIEDAEEADANASV